MKPVTFTTSPPKYQSRVVADVDFVVMAYLNDSTIDGRRIHGPTRNDPDGFGRGEITVRLPAPIMTSYGKGPKRPGVSELGKYRMIGALLEVTIDYDHIHGYGVLYKPLPRGVEFYPAVDLDRTVVKGYKNGRIDMLTWTLVAVTINDRGAAWEGLPPVVITPRNS
jgi:hypothetical protein